MSNRYPRHVGLHAPLPPSAAGAGSSGGGHGTSGWAAAGDGFWDTLDDAQRAALRAAGRIRIYRPGTPLCYQGDDSDHIIVIEEGWAKVVATGAGGRTVVLAVRGPGDLVCESAVLGGRERSATVQALDLVRGLVVPASRFTAFLDAHPAVWRLVTSTFVRRLDDAGRRVQAQVSADGARRLALLLAGLADLSARHAPPGRGGEIPIGPPLSQEELGSWMDASRETVARALSALRRAGLVRTGRRRLTVVDPAGLRAFAERADG